MLSTSITRTAWGGARSLRRGRALGAQLVRQLLDLLTFASAGRSSSRKRTAVADDADPTRRGVYRPVARARASHAGEPLVEGASCLSVARSSRSSAFRLARAAEVGAISSGRGLPGGAVSGTASPCTSPAGARGLRREPPRRPARRRPSACWRSGRLRRDRSSGNLARACGRASSTSPNVSTQRSHATSVGRSETVNPLSALCRRACPRARCPGHGPRTRMASASRRPYDGAPRCALQWPSMSASGPSFRAGVAARGETPPAAGNPEDGGDMTESCARRAPCRSAVSALRNSRTRS